MRESLENGLVALWAVLANFVPRLLLFLVILLIGYFVAKATAKAVDKVLERFGFDRAVERGGVARALSRSKYDASDIVSKLVYYALLLFVLQLAFSVFGPNAISDLIERVIAFLPSLVVAIIIVVVAAAIAAAVRELITNTLGGLSYGKVLGTIASVFILGLGIIAALNQVGVATTVTTPVLVAVLATLAGVVIVGAGGGLIRPMQARWERWLDTAERESDTVRAQVQQAPSVREQAQQAKAQYDASTPGGSTATGGATATMPVASSATRRDDY